MSEIHFDWTGDEYHEWKRANDAVTYSTLKNFADNPRRFARGIPSPKSDSLSFGNLLDCLLLEPHLFEQRYVRSAFDAYRSNAAKEWKAEQESLGRTVVKNKDLVQVYDALGIVKSDPQLSTIFHPDNGDGVVAVTATLAGVNACCLIDWVPNEHSEYGDALMDLKSGDNITQPDNFARSIATYRYHWQAAMYLDLWNAVKKDNRTRWLYPLVDNSAPYECGLMELDEFAIEVGRREYRAALAKYLECTKTQVWPSPFDFGPVNVGLPQWYKEVAA